MRCEIKIVLEQKVSNKAKGNCFEDLMRKLISIHQYEVRGNINFSGMEIDLVASHKHTNESLYVECKAKEKVTSDELSKFAFNTDFREADKGYFFRTQELESQAGALLSEIRSKEKYKKLTFFEPKDIVQMLSDAKLIFEPKSDLASFSIAKQILAITYFGDFIVYLVNDFNSIPTKFLVFNASKNQTPVTTEYIELLKERIEEISNLKKVDISYTVDKDKSQNKIESIESISEVQESENWFDYLPASSARKHFVGRDEIRTQIMGFFKEVINQDSDKRVFYLNGKSGWGKSSLVLELKNRCRNRHYKKKFYGVAIDTRSAISENFAALSLKRLITKAIEDGFITKEKFLDEIKFTSSIDLLSSDSIVRLLEKLKAEDKCLVLIFDQFEDVFRKKDFFKTFYKLLTDVTDLKPNIIIGFSWKSDFFIQSNDPAYHIWQQAREQAREFNVGEFGEREIDGVIKQLEDTIGKLDVSIKNRIKESSQGLPWLTKKLCIHILNQINSGIDKENLIESNLNISELFKNDEERVSSDEFKAVKLIAKRAYDGNFFDESEVGDLISAGTISELLHKRLIIRSGANYNIYWDIYRDYLATGSIPMIGESYLLRQGVNLCLEAFLLFDKNRKETIDSLLNKHSKAIGAETLYNILVELRNLGIVQKQGDYYFIPSQIEISEKGFKDYFSLKFLNYTPYIALRNLKVQKIFKSDVITVLKNIFKQDFQDNTWDTYAKTLISWFLITDLDTRLIAPQRGRGNGVQKLSQGEVGNYLPRSSFKEIYELIPLLTENSSIGSKYYRDLLLIGLIDENRELTKFAKELILKDENEIETLLKAKVLELPKMTQLKSIIDNNPKIKAKELINQTDKDFFDGKMESSKVIYVNKATSWIK